MNDKVGWGWNPPTRLDIAKDAIREFVESIYADGNGKDVEIRVVTFNWKDREQYERNKAYSQNFNDAQEAIIGTKLYTTINSSNYSSQLREIDDIDVPTDMGTNITAGINKAAEELNNFTNKENENVVIFLGDGSPSSKFDSPSSATTAATTLKLSATLYTIGFGIDYDRAAQSLLRNMASENEKTGGKLYYSANDRDSLINSFDAISSEVGKEPDVDYKTSADGIVTINLSNTLAADQKITITVDGTPTEYDYNSLPSELTYDSSNRTITWDITGYAADAELTISYVLSK